MKWSEEDRRLRVRIMNFIQKYGHNYPLIGSKMGVDKTVIADHVIRLKLAGQAQWRQIDESIPLTPKTDIGCRLKLGHYGHAGGLNWDQIE